MTRPSGWKEIVHMKTTIRNLVGTVAVTAVTLSAGAWLLAQGTEGVKETDKFVKEGQNTTNAINDARQKTQNALDAYNQLTQGDSKDMKGDYKKLLKAQKDMNNSVGDARKANDDLDKQAAVYFTQRSSSVNQIQDPALRDKGKTRLETSQKEFDKVKASLSDADQALAPFSKSLSDQIAFLGQDLTPSAAAAMKPQSAKLNQEGSSLFNKIDSATGMANKYFASLKAPSPNN
jgi:hypothetical protein